MQANTVALPDLVQLRLDAVAINLARQRRVYTDQTGAQLSGFRGRGMDFEEHRAYLPGDDVRSIDWRVTARTSEPHVKVFKEERERPVLVGVDYSPAMFFATRTAFKSVFAAHTASLLAWASLAHGDRVGGLTFGGQHHEVRPAGGKRGVLNLLQLLATAHQPTDTIRHPLSDALARLRRVARPGSLVYLCSDFAQWDADAERHLMLLARHVELVLVVIHDPLESVLPAGAYQVANMAGKRLRLTTTAKQRTAYQAQFQARQTALADAARQAGAHRISITTAHPPLPQLLRGLGIPSVATAA